MSLQVLISVQGEGKGECRSKAAWHKPAMSAMLGLPGDGALPRQGRCPGGRGTAGWRVRRPHAGTPLSRH